MTAIQTALKLWVKMTLVDGTIHEQEREFLAYMLQTYAPEHDLDTLIEAVRDTDLATLTGQVDAYADRFFIAMNALAIAHCDDTYSDEERRLFQTLLTAFEITDEDAALLAATVADQHSASPSDPPARVEALFAESSFYRDH